MSNFIYMARNSKDYSDSYLFDMTLIDFMFNYYLFYDVTFVQYHSVTYYSNILCNLYTHAHSHQLYTRIHHMHNIMNACIYSHLYMLQCDSACS